MYIRWKYEGGTFAWRDRGARYDATGGHLFSLELIESRRLDGQPRQRVVAYLGHVNTYRLEDPDRGEQVRTGFWEKLDVRLQRLCDDGRVDSDTWERLLDELEVAIPRDAEQPLALPERARSAIRRGNTASRRAWAETRICTMHHIRRQVLRDLAFIEQHAPDLMEHARQGTASVRQAKQLARLRRSLTPAP